MGVEIRKPGGSVTCPAGHVLVAVTVPLAALIPPPLPDGTPAPVTREMKVYRGIRHAIETLTEATPVIGLSDSDIEAQAAQHVANIAAETQRKKAARPNGSLD